MRAGDELARDGFVRVRVGQIAGGVMARGARGCETGGCGWGSDEVGAAVAAGEAF